MAKKVLSSIPQNERKKESAKPFVSVVAPAFNEAAIIEQNLTKICTYMETLASQYQWELIVVNDGSSDDTGEIADAFAAGKDNVTILHHFVNLNVGQALRYAFNNCRGDYIVVMDIDLSYSPEHIGKLLDTIIETRAKVVLASPYMKGGQISKIPWLRKTLSIYANKFLSYTARGGFSTLTGMVRAYDTIFVQSLNLKSMDISISAEIIYKAMVMGARIKEIPAHLDWSSQKAKDYKRKSSIKIKRSIIAYLLSGFIFRPFIFFILPGFLLTILAFFSFSWVFIHTVEQFNELPASFGSLGIRVSAGVAAAYQFAPHTFIIGGISLILAIQLISLGFLALQNKKYFEELFHLGTNIYKSKGDKFV